MDSLLIFNIQKYCVHDGPGIRTVVFFQGCPMRCRWCANPESHEFEPELMIYPDKCIGCGRCRSVCGSGCFLTDENGEIRFERRKCISCGNCAEVCYAGSRCMSGKLMTLDEIKKNVDRDMVFYKNSGGGITFSGGEPMCFPDQIYELAEYYKKQGVTTAVETCGYVPFENFEKVLPYIDLVMYDLKIMDDEKHIKYTGGSNKQILENLRKISQKVRIVVRIPIIPGINDSDEDIDQFGKFITELNSHITELNSRIDTIHILPYHNFGLNKYDALGKEYLLYDIKSPSHECMEDIKSRLELFGFKVITGG